MGRTLLWLLSPAMVRFSCATFSWGKGGRKGSHEENSGFVTPEILLYLSWPLLPHLEIGGNRFVSQVP